MNIISGTIVSAVPSGSYQTQFGEVFTTILTIRTATGDYTGEIGSKALADVGTMINQQIDVEWRETEHGVKFKKYNPKYANQSQQQAPPQSRQQTNAPKPVPETDFAKEARLKLICAYLQANDPPNYKSITEFVKFILDGRVEAAEPENIVDEVRGREVPPDEDIPWENA